MSTGFDELRCHSFEPVTKTSIGPFANKGQGGAGGGGGGGKSIELVIG